MTAVGPETTAGVSKQTAYESLKTPCRSLTNVVPLCGQAMVETVVYSWLRPIPLDGGALLYGRCPLRPSGRRRRPSAPKMVGATARMVCLRLALRLFNFFPGSRSEV